MSLKIAVIGSGIAGLASAWLAERAGHRVTIFEKHPSLGMDAHSIDLDRAGEVEAGRMTGAGRIDLPPRMFNQEEWPTLTALYAALGVKTKPVSATKSFSVAKPDPTAALKPWLNLGDRYLESFKPSLLFNSKARRVAAEVKRMHQFAMGTDLDAIPVELTFGEYLNAEQFDETFVREFLFPGLAATVFTCSYSAIGNYPAKIVLASLLKQFDRSPLQRTELGTRDVVERLTAKIQDIRLESVVAKIRAGDDHVSVKVGASNDAFDHLVIATQANAAGEMLPADFAETKMVLNQFRYENVPVVIHSDASFVPVAKGDQACFNFVSNAERLDAMCTIDLRQFYRERNMPQVFQTIRPVREVAASKTLSKVCMQRPVVTSATGAAIEQLQALQGREANRVWFCGSYAAQGVPLLESGVVSAINWAKQMGWTVDRDLTKFAPVTV